MAVVFSYSVSQSYPLSCTYATTAFTTKRNDPTKKGRKSTFPPLLATEGGDRLRFYAYICRHTAPRGHKTPRHMDFHYATHIRRIEISSLWNGRKPIDWTLRPDVNVLSGKNGAGKSTILARLVQRAAHLAPSGTLRGGQHDDVALTLAPDDAELVRYDLVRSVDSRILPAERIATLADGAIVTELDWQLYRLQRRYLDYQVNVGNRMIALLTEGSDTAREEAAEAAAAKTQFRDLIDDLFSETGKHLDRSSNELRFLQYDEPLSPYVLSSGEKQMLILLLTALVQDRRPTVFFMDEPEVSLHFDWQKRLISMVRALNPRAQIILTTHSPAVILDGWEDHVTEIEDITR